MEASEIFLYSGRLIKTWVLLSAQPSFGILQAGEALSQVPAVVAGVLASPAQERRSLRELYRERSRLHERVHVCYCSPDCRCRCRLRGARIGTVRGRFAAASVCLVQTMAVLSPASLPRIPLECH